LMSRWITPDNILLAADGGQAMVTDFGIARAVDDAPTDPGADAGAGTRLTATGVAIGTPAYMSPEQCAGDRTIDRRSDLYALGVLAYHMLTGQPPFVGGNSASLLVKQLTERPVPLRERRPDVPADLSAVVMRLLEKNPDDRFPDAAAVIRALDGEAFTSVPAPAPAQASVPASVPYAVFTDEIEDKVRDRIERQLAKEIRRHRKRRNRGKDRDDRDDDSGEHLAAEVASRAVQALNRNKKELTPEEQLAKRGRGYRRQIGGFFWTSGVCIAVNYMTSPHVWWAQWVVFGVGIGVVASTARLIGDGINPVKLFWQSMGQSGLPASQKNVLRLVAPARRHTRHGRIPTEVCRAGRRV
jgi:cation transport regulator ChaB